MSFMLAASPSPKAPRTGKLTLKRGSDSLAITSREWKALLEANCLEEYCPPDHIQFTNLEAVAIARCIDVIIHNVAEEDLGWGDKDECPLAVFDGKKPLLLAIQDFLWGGAFQIVGSAAGK